MNAYNYDHDTGEFLYAEPCEESPLEPGVFIFPGDSTSVAPPDPRDGFAACFRDGEWLYVPDHRGEKAYSVEDSLVFIEVKELGDIPAGYVSTPPPDDSRSYVWSGSGWALPPPAVEDYDRAMEDPLRAERSARGYTTREPSDYKDSAVPRWAQDAADWIAHRDAVMLYGLEIMNHYAETGEAPTLEEFKAALPVIVWSFDEA